MRRADFSKFEKTNPENGVWNVRMKQQGIGSRIAMANRGDAWFAGNLLGERRNASD
jgi:hypothetical protein